MFFLNLTLLQFAAVFGSISALSVALYLLDRSRRRQVVSTLRFWVAAEQPAVAARRRRIHQPWSLILQLASMALLLLALGELRWGAPGEGARDHVLILDSSAWMAARSGSSTLMDAARQRALQYVRALPARDRVMLVRADALATPVTAFEPDRHKVERAIADTRPGATALSLDEALAMARHAQAQEDREPGEIVYVGSGRIATGASGPAAHLPGNLRALLTSGEPENCGLRKIGVRRSPATADIWEIYVSARNYGAARHTVTLTADFSGYRVGTRRLTLDPNSDGDASFELRTSARGALDVRLSPDDAFPSDNRAELDLPAQPILTAAVYSAEPDLLRPLLAATPRVAATYHPPEEYRPDVNAGLVILDRMAAAPPKADSLWIDPPAEGSPIPVRQSLTDVPFSGWGASPITSGLHTKDFKLDRASVFAAGPDDTRVGEVAAGPVIVARNLHPRLAVFGFHPEISGMRYELATPLLFANLLRWYAPEIFLHSEIGGASAGDVKLDLDSEVPASDVRVTAGGGRPVPFTVRDRTLRFFSGTPGSVRVVAGDREYLYSLVLPQVGEAVWSPPAGVARGIPHFAPGFGSAANLWPWLAVLGGLGLLAEWLLFGRARRIAAARPIPIRRSRPENVGVGR
jgi:hypothetical protein